MSTLDQNIELDIAIAEACGWTKCELCESPCGYWYPPNSNKQSGLYGRKVPNYCGDLNAMHEAEMTLSTVPPEKGKKDDRTRYRENLCVETLGAGGPITAPALLRAKAFVKTVHEREIQN